MVKTDVGLEIPPKKVSIKGGQDRCRSRKKVKLRRVKMEEKIRKFFICLKYQ